MKLKTGRNQLVAAASVCAAIADRKGTLPILACTKLDLENGTLSATDLNVSTTRKLDSDGTGEGSVCINAKDFLDRVRQMPDGEVGISVKENTVTITSGKRRYRLPCLPGDEFPVVPEFTGEWLTVERLPLLDAITSTCYAVSADETRLHLNSLLFTSESGKLVCVATDGHRLALDKQPIDWNLQTALLPLSGVHQVRKLLEDAKSEGSIKLGVAGKIGRINWFVSAGETELSIKLVDAEFPPYQQVIPEECTHMHKVPRLALLDAVRAVSVAANERTGGVKLSFEKGNCTIESEDAEQGEGHDVVPITDSKSSQRFVFGCNGKYLVEALHSFAGDEVTIEGGGELDPVKITDGGQRVNVTMPMRI